MLESVTILTPHALAELSGPQVNPLLTIVARHNPGDVDLHYYLSDWHNGPHERVTSALRYMQHMRTIALAEGLDLPETEHVVFQAEDVPVPVPSVTWESRQGWQDVRLIPDLYYYLAGGYEDFLPELPSWNQRAPSVVWRGSSTGLFAQLADDLDALPRYRLSRLAAELGARADVGIFDVVQAASPHEADVIRARLTQEGLLRPFIPMTEMARHRFILDMDGNSNSWNFMMKLRLGCCVLRVESGWHQWFADRLIAWRHYVPIAPDLSDFIERAHWCFANSDECAAIAERGRQFALDMTFAGEMSLAARSTFAAP